MMPRAVHDLDQFGDIKDGSGWDSVFQPDILVGAQLAADPAASPEKRLVIAFLSCGLMDAEDGRLTVAMKFRKSGEVGEPGEGKKDMAAIERRRNKAREWIMSDDYEWAFSFVRVCEMLDLEPDYVRRKVVARWK